MLHAAGLLVYLLATYLLGRLVGRSSDWLGELSAWLPLLALIVGMALLVFPGLLILDFLVAGVLPGDRANALEPLVFFGGVLGQVMFFLRGERDERSPLHAGRR